MSAAVGDTTPWPRVLDEVTRGERVPAEELLPLVYEELRALARRNMASEAKGATLQPTLLVHEAYLRLVGQSDPGWNGRGHFYGAAARAMRRILVEHARRRGRLRHGGGRARINLSRVDLGVPLPDPDLEALEEAVSRLEQSDPRKGEVLNLRFYAGLTAEETAKSLDLSLRTVEREWRFIKNWLRTELGGS